MRILFLGEPQANALHWMNAMRKDKEVEVINWHLAGGSGWSRVVQWFAAIFTIRRIAKRFKPDLVIGYRTTSYGFLAAVCGIKPCVIAAQGESDVWPPNHWTANFKKQLVRYAIKKADLVHAWESHIEDTLIQFGAKKNQLFVLPRGIDTCLFGLPSHKPKGPVRLITTRGLFPEYHHDIILEALAKIKSQGFEFRYSIVGTGILRKKLELLSQNLLLTEEVEFVGEMNNEELPQILQLSHIYIAMPETEGISASLFEAMACGCFPIVSDLAANRLYIESGNNGILIPQNNKECLADTLQRVFPEVAWRESVVAKNRELVEEKADLRRNMDAFLGRYRKLIEK